MWLRRERCVGPTAAAALRTIWTTAPPHIPPEAVREASTGPLQSAGSCGREMELHLLAGPEWYMEQRDVYLVEDCVLDSNRPARPRYPRPPPPAPFPPSVRRAPASETAYLPTGTTSRATVSSGIGAGTLFFLMLLSCVCGASLVVYGPRARELAKERGWLSAFPKLLGSLRLDGSVLGHARRGSRPTSTNLVAPLASNQARKASHSPSLAARSTQYHSHFGSTHISRVMRGQNALTLATLGGLLSILEDECVGYEASS